MDFILLDKKHPLFDQTVLNNTADQIKAKLDEILDYQEQASAREKKLSDKRVALQRVVDGVEIQISKGETILEGIRSGTSHAQRALVVRTQNELGRRRESLRKDIHEIDGLLAAVQRRLASLEQRRIDLQSRLDQTESQLVQSQKVGIDSSYMI